jgi:membrane fusion protein (multidrug efflux system)
LAEKSIKDSLNESNESITKSIIAKLKTRKKIIIISLLVIFSLFLLVSIGNLVINKFIIKKEAAKPTLVKFDKPVLGDISEELKYTGTLDANKTVTILPKSSGVLETLYVREGDFVRENQVIGEIEKKAASLNLEQAQAVYNLTNTEFERANSLFKGQYISKSEFDQISSKLQVNEVQLKLAQLNLDNCYIKSTVSGIIAILHVQRGQVLGPAVPICLITDISSMKIKINISEKYYSFINVKKNEIVCYVKPVSYPDEQFKAKIFNISPFVSPENRTFWAEILIENKKHLLTAGMFSEIKMVINQKSNALLIPNEAVNEDSSVWVLLDENRKAKKIKPVIGIKDDKNTEIISGITINDKVIVEGNRFIDENSMLNPVPARGYQEVN